MGSTLDTEVGRWMLDTIRSRILRDMTEKFLINSIDRVGRSLSLLFIPIYSALSDIWVVITGNTQLFYSDTINLLLDSTLIPCMLNIKGKTASSLRHDFDDGEVLQGEGAKESEEVRG